MRYVEAVCPCDAHSLLTHAVSPLVYLIRFQLDVCFAYCVCMHVCVSLRLSAGLSVHVCSSLPSDSVQTFRP